MSSKPPATRAGNIDKVEFCRACGRFATGVTIATILDSRGAPHGVTVSSFTSVSLAPPLILICIDHGGSIIEHLRRIPLFGINVLREDQRDLSQHFARKGHDRFAGVPWYPGESGVPLLPGVLAAMECEVTESVAAGDHDILIAEVLRAEIHEGRPLIYFASEYRGLEQ